MAPYAKPKKTKTMERGLRPAPHPSLVSFSQKEIKKMEERIEAILENNRILSKQEKWIINQALLAISFRKAITNEQRNEIMRRMQKHQPEGHKLGFSSEEIRSLNRLILEKDQASQLESLYQRLLLKRES